MWSPELSALLLLCVSGAEVVSAPVCQSVAPNQTRLDQVHTAFTEQLPGFPFGLTYAAEHNYAFVSLNAAAQGEPSTLGVLNTTTFPPVLIHEVPLQDPRLQANAALGVALSSDGKYVFVTAGTGAYIVDTRKAIAGVNGSIVGVLNGNRNITGDGAIEITLTHDDAFAFVSQEYGASAESRGNVDVFKLDYTAHNAVSSKHVGYINLGNAVVGSALSPDGQYLYVTSEGAGSNFTSAGLASANQGILSVLDVNVLKNDPSRAQVSNVTAGCQPVREIVSSDGKLVWVTARASNHVLGFNASALVHDPANSLLFSLQVGTAPVGLTFAKHQSRIITADSDRFGTPNAHTGLTVVDVKAAVSGMKDAVLGYIATGLFPREFAISRDRKTLLVADFSSRQIQAVDLTTLP